MPSYQLCLILKSALSRPLVIVGSAGALSMALVVQMNKSIESLHFLTELHHALRRSCETILEKQGIIRSLENMGHKPLPNRIRKDGEYHIKGRYFLVNYESPSSIQKDVKEYLHRDLDVLSPNIILRKEETTYSPKFTPCIFGELPNPEHEKRVWRSKILRHLKLSRKNKEKTESTNQS